MRSFWRADEPAWTQLERVAAERCVVFGDCELPPGTVPRRGRVGVERDDTGVWLFVDRCDTVAATGAVREWLAYGGRHFPAMVALRAWVCGELRAAYPRSVDEVVDVGAVSQALDEQSATKRTLLDATAIFTALATEVRGQRGALDVLAGSVAGHLARRRHRRPLSLLLVGPSGVGKTRTVETLAQLVQQHGHDTGHVRVNLSEFREAHRVSALLGAPPGYAGHHTPVPLLETLRATPGSVILFDELDKAHPDVWRVLMQALDRGELATSGGATVACERAIFCFTANDFGITATANRAAGSSDKESDAACRAGLIAAGIAPELVGRITRCVRFRELDATARAEIMTMTIVRVAADYGVDLVAIEPQVVAELLMHPFRDDLGARPDEYRVERELGPLFARTARSLDAPLALRAGPPRRCLPFTGFDDHPTPIEGG